MMLSDIRTHFCMFPLLFGSLGRCVVLLLQVEGAHDRISFALKVHRAAIPESLEKHLILVGSHPRLQHYVLALRRQRPDVPVVVVTTDEVGACTVVAMLFFSGALAVL